ncbi:MAG: hypothetical protein QXI58_04465 [Candidatus Micrarchaeia archaeon]
MKGEAENVVVKIVIALLVLGVLVALLYIGLGPFREALQYNSCIGYLKQWCAGKDENENLDKSKGPCAIITSGHRYYEKLNELRTCKDV